MSELLGSLLTKLPRVMRGGAMRLTQIIHRDGLLLATKKVARRLGKISWRAGRKQYYKLLRTSLVPSDYGVLMAANWGDTTFEYCINASYGTYLSKYLRSIDHPFIFLDIGANQGIFSLIAAQNINCVQVLAFEPVRATFDMLERNIRANLGNEKVAAFNFGISNAEALLPIVIPEGHSGAASLHTSDKGTGRREYVTIKRASVIAGQIRGDLPICVKIDTEGHEKPVADGLAASPFADRIEAAFYEVDESWLDPKEIEFIFRRLNFSDFEIVGRKPRSKPHYDVMARRQSTPCFPKSIAGDSPRDPRAAGVA